jgi:CheY-like chemotaxis protein
MKTALIVDDSRLARTVLSRLLSEHGVATDEAPSAEAALDYLKEQRPDVVFLDHMMPGMDGLEALEAIKANPVTATIPVMMYTSQEGQLYLGQARALGAIGVLPKSLRPVEVTNVLRSLHLIPGEGVNGNGAADRSARKPTPADAQRLKELIEELFYEQAAVLREEIRKEFQLTAARLAAPPPQPRRAIEAPLGVGVFKLASAALLIVAVVLGYFYYQTHALLSEANVQATRLAADATALTTATTQAFDSLQTPQPRDNGLLDVLEWAADRDNNYAFGAVPLDDARAAEFASLFERLERHAFAGTVAIEVHVGRYCMNYAPTGGLELAPPDQLAATCEQVGWTEPEEVAMGTRQSVAFANTVAAATRDGRLRVETVSLGSTMPAVEYPLPDYVVTAGEWNAIAAGNQRVTVRLLPDGNEGFGN